MCKIGPDPPNRYNSFIYMHQLSWKHKRWCFFLECRDQDSKFPTSHIHSRLIAQNPYQCQEFVSIDSRIPPYFRSVPWWTWCVQLRALRWLHWWQNFFPQPVLTSSTFSNSYPQAWSVDRYLTVRRSFWCAHSWPGWTTALGTVSYFLNTCRTTGWQGINSLRLRPPSAW